MKMLKDNQKLFFMALLLVGAVVLTYYFLKVLGMWAFFTQLFYIPIILAAYWWKRKGLIVPIFLSVLIIIISQIYIKNEIIDLNSIARALMLIFIGIIFVYVFETTEKFRQIKEKYQRTKELMKIAFDSMNDELCIIDVNDFNIVSANSVFLKKIGKTEDEVIGKICYKLTHHRSEPCSPPDDKCPLIETIKTGKYSVAEHVHYGENDEKEYLEISTAPIKDENGKIIQVVHIARDISERKIAEETLRNSEFKFFSMFDKNRLGAIIVDNDRKIRNVNDAAAALIGRQKEDIIGQVCHSLICPVPQNDCPIFDHGINIDSKELTLLSKDRGEVPIEKTVTQIIVDGEIMLLEMFSDITEQKKTEELYLENERLAVANKTSSDFISTLNHELRTPLISVIGFSLLLKSKHPGELNKEQTRFIDHILNSGNHLLELITKMLDINQIETGKLSLNIEKISVKELIDGIIELLSKKAAQNNVFIEQNINPEIDIIEADFMRLKQILLNLLDNAIKFSKKEGGIIKINVTQDGEMARFSIADTGIGIKENELANMFTIFHQVDSRLSREYGGAGLGLAITRYLIELHGGKIMVKSEYGKGTTVTFLLPISGKKVSPQD